MAKVTYIEPRINYFNHKKIKAFQKRKVAAYARVSTDSSEQLTSYAAQVDYYKKYILQHPEWEYAGIYADEGISGLKTSDRTAFSKMIEDAKSGKIDLILTKSVSRFARNTVDSLVNIRLLKDCGTEVYFEKENIWSFDEKGEVLLTIMASIAQEESRSISENVAWGQRKRFADGKFSIAYSNFLGYDRGPDGKLVVNKEDAKTVRVIYRMNLMGYSENRICKTLQSRGILTPGGVKKWYASVIKSILTNEKYKGDALLQKSFTVDFLSKRHKRNEGELPMYYIENSHEGIIIPEEWDLTHEELARRRDTSKSFSSINEFSFRIVCANCGGYYGPKVFHSNDPRYRRVVWRCNDRYKGSEVCRNPNTTEEIIKSKFREAYNLYCGDRSVLTEDAILMRSLLFGNEHATDIDQYISSIRAKLYLIDEWDPRLFRELVDKVIVNQNESLTFCFRTGKEITI